MANSGSDIRRPGEFELIAKLFAPLAIEPGAFGLTDDAAVLARHHGQDLVVTADAIVEGVHFLASDPPDRIAQKALRVNLSDLAAKGCTPFGYLLTLCIPEHLDMGWLRAFAGGLSEDQREFGVSLLGGDTTATPGPLTIAITAFGFVPAGLMLRRSGAQAGDLVFVSGTIGDALGGLTCLRGEGASLSVAEREYLTGRYQRPEPRLPLGRELLNRASAALDISDGLVADIGHIAEISSVQVILETAKIPVCEALKVLWPNKHERTVRAATAGDDYEIAFTVPPDGRAQLIEAAIGLGIPVTQIGRCEAGKGVRLLDSLGGEMQVDRPGYVHI